MSREAVVFLLLLVSIAMAGFNSGNNLLYLISGVMLGAVLVSLAAGSANITGMTAERRLPRYAFADHPFRITIEITNTKRFLGSFGIELEGAATEAKPLFFYSVRNGGTETRTKQAAFPRRGKHILKPLVLRSSFPFGLFNMKRKVSSRDEMIVYPRIWDLRQAPGASSHIRDEFPTHLKGPGSGLYGFREYRHGEEATNISWKLSAKLGTLIVRETEHEERRRVCIVFDNAVGEASASALDTFEHAVSSTASLVWYLCRNNYSVKLVTRDRVIGYGGGPDQMHRMLVVLALIEPVLADRGTPVAGRSVLEGGIGVIVSGMGSPDVATKTHGDFSVVAGWDKRAKEQ